MKLTADKMLPTLHVDGYAFVDRGDMTILFDVVRQRPVLCLTPLGEYALARMLVEKTQYIDEATRIQGEALYRDEVMPEGRQMTLS